MSRYRKKYTDIEAIVWDGDEQKLIDFISGHPKIKYVIRYTNRQPVILIQNCNGTRLCRIGDFIVKTPNGCVYPLSPESFHASYEIIKGE